MLTTRTLGAITMLDLHGPLAAGHEDAALRKAVRLAFENGATHGDPQHGRRAVIDSSGVAALASGT